MAHDRSTSPGEPDYEEWAIDTTTEQRYVGTLTSRAPVLYEPESGLLHRSDVDEEGEQLVPHDEPSWELDADETLGDLLDRVEEEIGWESLSSFAEDHLGGDSDDGSTSGSE